MSEQGNSAPQLGAWLQQQGNPDVCQPLVQGGHGPERPVMQHSSNQSGCHVYQTTLMPPYRPIQQFSQSGMPNVPYNPRVQHNSQYHTQLGAQSLYHVAPPRSCLPPPPLLPPSSHGIRFPEVLNPPPQPPAGCPELLNPPPPPVPPVGYIMHRDIAQPTRPIGHKESSHSQLTQLPPLVSSSHRVAHSDSSSAPNETHLVFAAAPPLCCSSPPPPPVAPESGRPGSDGNEPTSSNSNAAIEPPSALPRSIGCFDPVMMNDVDVGTELTLKSQNIDSSVTVDCIYNEGAPPDSVVKGSIEMDNIRYEAGSSSQLNNLVGDSLCSTSDSDMDMEDAIMTLVEELETNDSRGDQSSEKLDAQVVLKRQSPASVIFSGLPGEGVVSCQLPGESSIMKSPFKVLQSYTSDDSIGKHCAENVKDVYQIPPAIDESAIMQIVGEHNLDGVSRSNQCIAYVESNPATSIGTLLEKQVSALGKETEMDRKKVSTTLASSSKPAELANIDGCKEFMSDEYQHPSEVNGHLKPDDMTSKPEKSRAKDTTTSLHLKVDEFGRLAKDVSSDSDSDDHHRHRRRGRRGRSRSISPLYRRRKSPPRRRCHRSRSRSYSPLRRRSRSRSPSYRRQSESTSERRGRDKNQTNVCFNFRNGRCQRGSSCRFVHQDSDKSGSSISYKRKQVSEVALGGSGSNFQEISKRSLSEMESYMNTNDRSHGSQQSKSTKRTHSDSGSDNNETDKNDTGQKVRVVNRPQLDQDVASNVSYLNKCGDAGGDAHVVESPMSQIARDQVAANLPADSKYPKSAQVRHPRDANSLPSLINSADIWFPKEPLGANHAAAVAKNTDQQLQKSNTSYGSVSTQHQSLATPHMLKTSDLWQDSVQSSSLSYTNMGSRVQPVLSENSLPHVPSDVTGTPFPRDATGHYTPQLQSSFSMMQANTAVHPPLISGGMPSYNQFSLPNHPSQQSFPLKTSFLPPPPRMSIYADSSNQHNSTSGNINPYHFERYQQPQRTDIAIQSMSSPYSGHVHHNFQNGGNGYDQRLPSVEAHRPPFASLSQRPNAHFEMNPHTQQLEGHHLDRNDQTFVQGLIPSTIHAQLNTSDGPSATETLPASETACHVSSQRDNISKNTYLNGPKNFVPTEVRFISMPGKTEVIGLKPPAAHSGTAGISEFGHSRTSVHCNMYVSANNSPLVSVLSQPQTVGEVGVEAHGLEEKFPSSISIRNAGQSFPRSGGDPYDPLFDSFDMSLNTIVNSEQVKKPHSTSDSDNMLKGSISHKPLDVEETNRNKESEAIASLTSSDNEEFGETADAEVGALENESSSNLVDMSNRDNPDEKSKDSRSMKLFKCAIANFVKETLKPSWRQGNMSKEAFKTIVKKTVEKVSGAMRGHRYPKSRAKINHYIKSSEHKLTKLVMGYVDKYVKV